MDKKSKEALRRYKKSRPQEQSSSDSSSSSDSDSGSSSSYSSSSSGGRKEVDRHRKKKARHAAAGTVLRRSSSTSADERRKREKREHACQKKLEAKRNHLKRKLKEAKLKKRAAAAAAAAAAAIGGHSHHNMSPATQAKLQKLAERKHRRNASKEHRERERDKHRIAAAAARAEREHRTRPSRSPTAKITKIRIHQDVKARPPKSPTRVHQQLMSREKIIIQARTRERTPSLERQRRDHKLHHHHDVALRDRERRDRERAEREAARDKERAEALARCQERQRERERLAREKLRREAEEADKKYSAAGLLVGGGERGERLLPRPVDREMAIAGARGYNSRERSLEAGERLPRHASKRELELYERERDLIEAERRGLLDRDELRREREYLVARRRELSPISEHYAARLREVRDARFVDEQRERIYGRAYLEEGRHVRERHPWLDPRELRERELRDIREVRELREMEHMRELYPDERERIARERERERSLAVRGGDWKEDWPLPVPERERINWDDGTSRAGGSGGGFVGGPVRGVGTAASSGTAKLTISREQRAPSEPDWDADETSPAAKNSALSVGSGGGGGGGGGVGGGGCGREIGSTTRVAAWNEHDTRENVAPLPREKHISGRAEMSERRWPLNAEWREDAVSDVGPSTTMRAGADALVSSHHFHREPRRGFRRGGHLEHGERNATPGSSYHRSHITSSSSLLTTPLQTQTGYHHTPRFPHKRNMTYTNPLLIKKQQAALAAAKAAAQASAVVAATTAVAAAKAAAQSAANATTNPGILGQFSGSQLSKQSATGSSVVAAIAEKPEAGEIVGDGSDNSKTIPMIATLDTKANGEELSEISDSEDDILDKDPAQIDDAMSTTTLPTNGTTNNASLAAASSAADTALNEADKQDEDEDDLLDFEEISDGELEEDARNKGVGDALGVDWASLVAETKRQAANANPQSSEHSTTAKQRWQPHRILLDVGVSMQMAGESYAKLLLQNAKQKLDEELCKEMAPKEKSVIIKEEPFQSSPPANESSTPQILDALKRIDDKDKVVVGIVDDMKSELPKVKLECAGNAVVSDGTNFDVEQLPALACIQVAERLRDLERRALFANACGPNSRALSARQDLKLRRQLCGLPAQHCDLPRPLVGASNKMKSKALALFQRAMEVK